MTQPLSQACHAELELQHGVLARWQADDVGLPLHVIEARLRHHHWQQIYRGVYATFTGEAPRAAILWAAVLRAGPGAALSHGSAAELDDLAGAPAPVIHVTIREAQRLRVPPGEHHPTVPSIVVHRSTRLDEMCHPCRLPRRTRVEETTIDLTQSAASLDEALDWVIRACSRRLTTPAKLYAAMTARHRLRWRRELGQALGEIGNGVHSLLERRYVRRVESAHGLPRPARQAHSRVGPRSRYLDNRYERFGVAVELDGQVAHPAEGRWRDIHRDNSSATAGIITLRYNWADVTARPCHVAAEVAAVLTTRGWAGSPHPCGPHCPIS